MNEFAQRHLMRTADQFISGVAAQTVILNWRLTNTGTYDTARGEYRDDGDETRDRMENVRCMVYDITSGDIQYGAWGSAQVGDLVMAFDRRLDLSQFEDLIIIYRMKQYRPLPVSDVPIDTIAAVIGDTQLFAVVHCRYIGQQQGVI